MQSVVVLGPEQPAGQTFTQCAMPWTCWMPAGVIQCVPVVHLVLQQQPLLVATPVMSSALEVCCASRTSSATTTSAAPDVGVLGRVWELSADPEGCRLVQAALDDALNDEDRAKVVLELKGRVWEAIRCPHANYVLQKCIEMCGPSTSQFIVDEILLKGRAGAKDVAQHKYGCRIIQRLLEHCDPEQIEELVEAFLSCAIALSQHEFGNFVMQQVLERGTSSQRRRLVRILTQHARAAGAHAIACAVVSKAFEHCSQQDALALAQALARERRLVVRMSCSRHGHGAAKAMLRLLRGDEREVIEKQLLENAVSIRASRYGKSVLACISSSALPDAARFGGA